MNSVKSVKPYGTIWDQVGASAVRGEMCKSIFVPIEHDLKQTVSKAILEEYYSLLRVSRDPDQHNVIAHVQNQMLIQFLHIQFIKTY